jgi:hypothetical protein
MAATTPPLSGSRYGVDILNLAELNKTKSCFLMTKGGAQYLGLIVWCLFYSLSLFRIVLAVAVS